MKIGEMSKIEA